MELDDLLDVYGTYFVHERFPRPIADGVQWIGGCSALFLDRAKPDLAHSALNTYLVVGEEKTLLVDTGHPALWPGFSAALEKALGGRPLDYVMPTHPEIPHGGSLTLLHRRWPGLTVVGDTRDYFLYHPEIPDGAYREMRPGERLDLGGGREFEIVEALFKDLPNTVWGFDHGSRTLFPADGFAFFHWHSQDACGFTTEDRGFTPGAATYAPMTEIVSGLELLDIEDTIQRFLRLVEHASPTVIAPAHGTVVTDLPNAFGYLEALRTKDRTTNPHPRDTGAHHGR
ncbi:FprA family A-type flavoprotein [Actinomadura sp. KC345]|uniref:MBL fold metallo-hydrolase n=1 Tax=Actinomadura sp. KC345 TaxID=2530371 RepID=UPI001051D21F|nr:MBL fold metallo-hydrolase [Actinomadura sp. KC345]TDC55169.1 FprA family A-type flavoprotein [Actinomadura sp. KC345]